MSDPESLLARRQLQLTSLWERLVRTLGVHTIKVLVDRAIWQTSQQHPILAHLQYNNNGLNLDALAGQAPDELDQALTALQDEVMLIMARLLGQDMAHRLLDELQTLQPAHEQRAATGGQ